MRLFVDGRRCPCDPGPADTLDDLLQGIRANNSPSHRAILGLVCDGIDVVASGAAAVLSKPATQFERVDVQTGAVDKLVAHTLEQTVGTLQEAEQERANVVTLFAEGKTGEAFILLGKCIGHWHHINEAICKSLGLMGMIDSSLDADLRRLAGALEPIAEKLSEIKVTVKSQDYVALSDILEYEFGEVTACWRRAIDAIMAHVTATEPHRPSLSSTPR